MIPLLYDLGLAPLERLGLSGWRRQVVPAARGRVLEVGGGTGLNLGWYAPEADLVFTEPDLAMLRRASRRATTAGRVEFLAADAQRLPFTEESFDSAVATLTFCTIADPAAAFAEVGRVLKRDGVLFLLEHVRTPRHWVARLQDTFTPIWKHLAHGCHLNRPTLELAQERGFTVRSLRTGLDGWLIAAELRHG
jgi:ubiquinone/menaquinone biosynthesis C-methylase UbiE